jgi:hypothetical protein
MLLIDSASCGYFWATCSEISIYFQRIAMCIGIGRSGVDMVKEIEHKAWPMQAYGKHKSKRDWDISYIKLHSGCFCVLKRMDDFTLGSGKFGGTFEVLERFCDVALLQEQLGHGCYSNVAFGVDWKNV